MINQRKKTKGNSSGGRDKKVSDFPTRMKDECKGIFLQKHQQGCLKVFYFMNSVKFQKKDPVFFTKMARPRRLCSV